MQPTAHSSWPWLIASCAYLIAARAPRPAFGLRLPPPRLPIGGPGRGGRRLRGEVCGGQFPLRHQQDFQLFEDVKTFAEAALGHAVTAVGVQAGEDFLEHGARHAVGPVVQHPAQ